MFLKTQPYSYTDVSESHEFKKNYEFEKLYIKIVGIYCYLEKDNSKMLKNSSHSSSPSSSRNNRIYSEK